MMHLETGAFLGEHVTILNKGTVRVIGNDNLKPSCK
jgi:hypothetical protein